MIPAAFDYTRVDTVDEAVQALGQHGDEAKVLAGGHSLIPLLRLRLAFPSVLVDVGRVEEMRGVRDDGNHLVIGAASLGNEFLNHEVRFQATESFDHALRRFLGFGQDNTDTLRAFQQLDHDGRATSKTQQVLGIARRVGEAGNRQADATPGEELRGA